MIRIGIVDFDTSHVVAFTQRLNHIDIAPEHWVESECRVTMGWPGTSAMMPERIPGFLEKVSAYGVQIVGRPEDLLGNIDAVLIESQQGSRHEERARPFLEAGLPTFVDKPFAGNVAQADAMIALAEKHGAPLMSASALRYAVEVQEALRLREQHGPILSADVWTACALHEGNPGLLHYGVHGVEMLYALMGTGCQEVRTIFQPGGEVVVGVWEDGRIGTVRGIRDGQYGFGCAVHYEKGHYAAPVTSGTYYSELLKRIADLFTTGNPPIPYAELREVMAFMDAALVSPEQGGAPVALSA
jgi:predicted dehydrogenase